jgi:cytochrome P450
LNIISSVGFGEHFPWNTPAQIESNRLPLSSSVVEAVPLTVLRALLPNWAYRLPVKSFAKAKLAFEEMERNFTDIIKAANTDTSGASHKRGAEQGDILRGLLQANETADDGQRLSDREVLADIYVSNAAHSFLKPARS